MQINLYAQCFPQDFVRIVAKCRVLHPGNGTRPMAEGIVGHPHQHHNANDGIGRSLLEELCEDGQQMVKVTKMYKNTLSFCFRRTMTTPST